VRSGRPRSRITRAIDSPILNSPYKQPDHYYEIGPLGVHWLSQRPGKIAVKVRNVYGDEVVKVLDIA
jgi:hypothetical protein